MRGLCSLSILLTVAWIEKITLGMSTLIFKFKFKNDAIKVEEPRLERENRNYIGDVNDGLEVVENNTDSGDNDDGSYLQGDPSSSDNLAKFVDNLEFNFGSLYIVSFVKGSVLPPHRHPGQSPIKMCLSKQSLLKGLTLHGERN